MAANPIFFTTVRNPAVQLSNANGTAFVSVMVGGTSGSKLESLIATNGDAAVDTVLQLAITISSVDYIIGEVSVPQGAGTNGSTPSVDLLNETSIPGLRSDGVNRYLYLASGSTLKVKAKVAIAGVYKMHVIGQAGDA